MKLFYSITTGPFLSAYSFIAKSDNVDDALKELMESNSERRQNVVEPGNLIIHRVIAHSKDDSLNESEKSWLMVVSPRWDVEWPNTAIYYHLYGRVRKIQNDNGEHEWKFLDKIN